MQSRKEMKKKQVRSQHFMLRAIASHIWCEIFHGAGGHFPCLRGYHWTKRSWDRREVGGIERGQDGWLCLPGKAWCEDVKLVKVCVYVHSFCMYPCMSYLYMSLHCHCPPNEWSSTMPTMHLQEEVGHYETYRENHLMLWLFMFSSRQNHVKRPSQWKKPKLHLKKAKVFRGSGFEVSGGKSKHQWIAGVASRLELVKMKFS